MTGKSRFSRRYLISSFLVSALPPLLFLALLSENELIFNFSVVGSASYNSTITNHTEVLPVSVDIIGMIALYRQWFARIWNSISLSRQRIAADKDENSRSRLWWRDLFPCGSSTRSRYRGSESSGADDHGWADPPQSIRNERRAQVMQSDSRFGDVPVGPISKGKELLRHFGVEWEWGEGYAATGKVEILDYLLIWGKK